MGEIIWGKESRAYRHLWDVVQQKCAIGIRFCLMLFREDSGGPTPQIVDVDLKQSSSDANSGARDIGQKRMFRKRCMFVFRQSPRLRLQGKEGNEMCSLGWLCKSTRCGGGGIRHD